METVDGRIAGGRARVTFALLGAVVVALTAACGRAGAAAPAPAPAPAVVRAPDLAPGAVPAAPQGKPLVTLSGRIATTNDGGALRLDQAALDRFGLLAVDVDDPWAKKRVALQGFRLRDLVELAKPDAGATTLHLEALDDYQIDLNLADVAGRRHLPRHPQRPGRRAALRGRRSDPGRVRRRPGLALQPRHVDLEHRDHRGAVTEPAGSRASRWERWARPRVLVAAVVVVLVTTVSLIATYSVLLDRMSRQVDEAQARSANLSNADRETLVLLQDVTQLGAGLRPGRDRAAPGRVGPADRGLHRLVRRRRPRGPGAAGRAGPAGGVPVGPAHRHARARRRPAPRGDDPGHAAGGADQHPAQRPGAAVLPGHDGVAGGEPARAAGPRDAGDPGARAGRRRHHGRAAPQPQRRRAGVRGAEGGGGRAAGRRGGAAGERGAVPVARAARLRPHDRHRRPGRGHLRQPRRGGARRLPARGAARRAAARARGAAGAGRRRHGDHAARRAAGPAAHHRAAAAQPRRPGPRGRGRVPEPRRRPRRPRPGVERPGRHRAARPGERAHPPRAPRPADRAARTGRCCCSAWTRP